MNRSKLHELTQTDLNAALIREGKLKAQLAAVRLLINEWNAETFTNLLSEDPLTIY